MLCRELQQRLGRFVGFGNNNPAVGCLGSQGEVNRLLVLRVLVQGGGLVRYLLEVESS